MRSTGWTLICRRPGPARTGTADRSSPATTRLAWGRGRRRSPTSPNSSSLPTSCGRSSHGHHGGRRPRRAGPPARRSGCRIDARTLARLEKALMNQGFWIVAPTGSGGCRRRRCGDSAETALRDVAQQLSGRHGERDNPWRGASGEFTGATRPWAISGDTEPSNVTRTLTNAVLRQAGTHTLDGPLYRSPSTTSRCSETKNYTAPSQRWRCW